MVSYKTKIIIIFASLLLVACILAGFNLSNSKCNQIQPQEHAIIKRYSDGSIYLYAEIDSEGNYDGLYIKYYPSSDRSMRYFASYSAFIFSHGKKNGPYMRLSSGRIISCGIYKDDLPYEGWFIGVPKMVIGEEVEMELLDEEDVHDKDPWHSDYRHEYSKGMLNPYSEYYNMEYMKNKTIIKSLNRLVKDISGQIK